MKIKNSWSADLILIGDGPVHQTRRPMVYFGARGVMQLEATIYGPLRALHDGHYGNWVPNPAAMAATLLAQMRDDNGRILIPGFSDGVRAITPEEQTALKNLPPVGADLKKEFGIGRSEGSEDLPASLMRPAFNIRGIRAGQVGDAAANAIPTTASISLDFRLVPDQIPAAVRAAVEHFLTARGWSIVADEPDLATRLSNPRIIKLKWDTGYPGAALRHVLACRKGGDCRRYPSRRRTGDSAADGRRQCAAVHVCGRVQRADHLPAYRQSRQQPACGQ